MLRHPIRKFDLRFACAETLWYLAGACHVNWMTKFAPSYEKYADDGVVRGAYGPRLRLDQVVSTLQADKESRQAVMPVFRHDDLYAAIQRHKSIPCTLTMQFMVRNDRLHMFVNMRSNDIWMGMPYDVFAFSVIHRVVADSLRIPCGVYTHNVASLHLYTRHLDKAKIVGPYPGDLFDNEWSVPVRESEVTAAAFQMVFNNAIKPGLARNSMISDLISVVAGRYEDVYCPVFKQLLERECSSSTDQTA